MWEELQDQGLLPCPISPSTHLFFVHVDWNTWCPRPAPAAPVGLHAELCRQHVGGTQASVDVRHRRQEQKSSGC